MKNLFILILFCSRLFSQSWERNTYLPEDLLNFIYSSGSALYTATDSLIYISTNQGSTWSILSVNSPRNVQTVIEENGILYAGTYGNGVFRSTDGGINWSSLNSGLSSWGYYVKSFYRINQKLYMGSDGGGVYFLDLTNPSKWIEYNENLPSVVAWTIICMTASGNNLIISSGSNGYIHVRPEGSAGWEETIVDPVKMLQPWSLLSFGNYLIAGTSRGIYRSSDNGFHWDSVGVTALPLRTSILKHYGKTIYAGFARSSDYFIWTSQDSGMTWQSLDHQFAFLSDLHITESSMLAACDNGLWSFTSTPVAVRRSVKMNGTELSFYPNPFNPETTIKINITEKSRIGLELFGITGERIEEIFNGDVEAGNFEYRYNGKNLSGGIYFVVLNINENRYFGKLILMK